MSPAVKNIVAVVVGIVVGGLLNMAIIMLGPFIVPLPEGVDMSDMEKFAENLKQFKPIHFLVPWLAHALGTLVGAFTTAKLAASRPLLHAMGIGCFFLLGGIMMVAMYGGPAWFVILDLVAAYLPMAYLGGRLAANASAAS